MKKKLSSRCNFWKKWFQRKRYLRSHLELINGIDLLIAMSCFIRSWQSHFVICNAESIPHQLNRQSFSISEPIRFSFWVEYTANDDVNNTIITLLTLNRIFEVIYRVKELSVTNVTTSLHSYLTGCSSRLYQLRSPTFSSGCSQIT